jgi:hypothetical protein
VASGFTNLTSFWGPKNLTCDKHSFILADDDFTETDQTVEHHEDDSKPQLWEEFGHRFEPGELELLKQSIVQMALSRIDGQDELFVGG